ncbi:MAG: ATP-binding protein [Bacteroidales bacterium]|nr:ATP-binding protein [Bacteroidales bacterium]
MIQEIKIRNFLSFKDEVKFSFEATNDKFAEDSQVVTINENTRLLRFAIIYGYNASGKSNLISVLDFLSYFWSAKPNDMDSKTGVIPFKLDGISSDKPSSFEVVFFVQDTKYCYQLELDQHQVYLEKLSYYKTTQPIMLFERTLKDGQSDIQFNPKAEKISSAAKDMISVNCLKNTSFFVARNQVNVNLPIIDAAKDWMRKQLMPVISPTTGLTSYAQKKASENRSLINYIVKFLHEADFNVTDVSANVISKQLTDDAVKYLTEESDIADEETAREVERIKKERTIKQIQTVFEHTVENDNGTETYQMDKKEESTGTMRTFGIEAALYEALKDEAVLPIDELETSLHPMLLEKILFEYLKTPSRSQLIVTTHNDGLLDLLDDLIRKDSVWFTEKKKSGITDLYKLTDFRGINRLSSIREAYRNKRFGATMR